MGNAIIWLVFSGLFFTVLLPQCPVWAESTRIPKNTSAESADETAIRQRIQTLQKQLKTAQKQYDEGRPKLSDSAYDARYQELLKLEHDYPQYQTADSATNLIGTVGTIEPVQGRQSQPLLSHHVAMLSLQKAYQISEIEAWIQSVRELGKLSASTPLVLVVEPKWDGLAVACHYRHGHLVAGAIRGDGQQGQLVTANLGTIQSLPVELTKQNSIPQLFEVRGEVVMSRAQFDALNETLEKQHKPLFSTPRNAATGSLRQKNPQVTADRKLDFIAYSGLLSEAPREDFSSHWQILEQLAQWGFQVSAPRVRCENIDCVKAFIDKWSSERKTFPIETDGVVIKVDSLALQHQLGATAKTPRWAIAYKYTPQQAETVVETIDYSRSSSGRLTPIAVVAPIMINGTTIRRVNLHSLEEMARLDVRVGDTVVIHKAGEIIPQIVDVVKTKRHPRKRPEPIPKQ